MNFINSYNAKLEERNSFIESKKTEIATNESNVQKCKEALEKAKVEYYKAVTNATLTEFKSAKTALEETEKALNESKSDLRQLNQFFYFVYDKATLINECKTIYNDSGIDTDLQNYISLLEQAETLKKTIKNKWNTVESEIAQATSLISRLYLPLKDRKAVSNEIDQFINPKSFALQRQDINCNHHCRSEHELKSYAIEEI